ncbi:MAG: cob(I)yrinic acid a,c-diamide adenosyltransferase [Proteobacteria bacterium]|nr:cob(I)yrinic acid a,c-diamide adenosyltransferase [Pseudomonadota bacterium]
MKKKKKGLIVVFTGNGKGKTTAALGVALRASGHGMNTLMIEFMKEEGKSGEQKVCPAMLEKIDIYLFGMGFVFRGDDPRPHMEIVENAWLFMEEMLSKKKYQILILDELSVALSLELFPVDSVINFLTMKDDALHVIITGRDAPHELIKIADIVTEMKEVKHIFKEGTAATLGLDY